VSSAQPASDATVEASPYPLLLEPILKQKVWGGRRLAEFGKQLPPNTQIGESWEVADLPTTAPGGGGGDPARSVIATGPLAGQTLHDALDRWGSHLLGDSSPTPEGDFPLLVKWLDAAEHLSVQVHPTAEYVEAHPEANLKTESWVVLGADADSHVYLGLRDDVTPADVARGARDGTLPGMLRRVAAVPGECHHLPSGTIHALGAGVLVAEVQTPSDTTFRLYDWASEYGREGRELHLQQALECLDFGDPPAPTTAPDDAAMAPLVSTEHYWIWQLRPGDRTYQPRRDRSWRVVMVTAGQVRMRASDESFPLLELVKGDTVVVPAANVGALLVEGDMGSEALLVGTGEEP
jgi:mannose-6-phosphate isomerase